jgi:transposase
VQEIEQLKREGLSIQAISNLTGYDRTTIRKYLRQAETTPVYGLRPARSSILDAFNERFPWRFSRWRTGESVWQKSSCVYNNAC